MDAVLRPADADDLPGIMHVFLDCWRTSYAGVLPEDTIATMTYERASQLWREALGSPAALVLVADTVQDGVAGVTRFELERPVDGPVRGIVHSLYVSPATQGLGLGSRLLDAARERLLADGAAAVCLWVFAANQSAVDFYRGRGWLPDGTTRTQPGFGQPELRLCHHPGVA